MHLMIVAVVKISSNETKTTLQYSIDSKEWKKHECSIFDYLLKKLRSWQKDTIEIHSVSITPTKPIIVEEGD